MDPRIKTIILGLSVLFIVVLIIGIALYLGRSISTPKSNSLTQQPNSLSSLPVISPSPASSPSVPRTGGQVLNTNTKSYQGTGFILNYPLSWGLITCTNSQNFEFDPDNPTDIKNLVCDRAIKPVTILLTGRISCNGTNIRIGDKDAIRSKEISTEGDIFYRWCFMTGNIGFDITHRVSVSGSMASSKNDFSSDVEKMIETIKKS